MTDTGMAYIAQKSCGCICGAIADEPDMKRDIAEMLSEWVKKGLTIDRVTHDVVRADFVGWNCPHEAIQEKLL